MLLDGSWIIILYVIDIVATIDQKQPDCPANCICESFRVNCGGANVTEATFEYIPLRVEELDLSNNNLRSIPKPLLQYAEIIRLNLSSNRIASLSRNVFDRMSKIKTIDLSRNLIKSLSDIEAGFLFTRNTKLQTLNLSGNAIGDLGDGYDQILYSDSLTHLDVSRCSISRLQGPVVLQGLPKLARLNLSKNTVARVDGLASDTLQSLDVSECNVQFMRADTLEKLPSLREVRAFGNQHLTDQHLKPASASVTLVDVSYCALRTNYASNLVETHTAILRGNALAELASGAFENNSKLEHLDLADNRIVYVDEFAFRGATSLKFVDLSGNRIAALHPSTFSRAIALDDLRLSGNLFDAFPQLDCASLVALDLSDCGVRELGEKALSGLPALRTLNVSYNRMARLPAPQPLRSSSLRLLDASYCRLTTVDEFALAELTALEEIDLTGNRLALLKSKTFVEYGRLKHVSLAENPWICDCLDENLRKMWRYVTATATESSRLASSDLPLCQHPENVTNKSWYEACAAQWDGEPRKSKDIIVLIIIVTVLLVSGIVACVVAVKESWTVRRSRQPPIDEEHEHERLNEQDGSGGIARNDQEVGESIRKLTQLPSYDEALLLPKPPPLPSTSTDETSPPSTNIRQTVIRLEMSKKRQSATQTEETIDELLREIRLQEGEEEREGEGERNPSLLRRTSLQEMQYINIRPSLPIQCTEL